MKRLRLLTLVLVVLAALLYSYKKSVNVSATIAFTDSIPANWFITSGEILTPEEDRRMPDQTYLTFPEWFLVFSPEDQADFFKSNSPSQYPYQSQVAQFWDSYGVLCHHIENHYPYNEEYHTMIQVIGWSTELEYDTKSWYETIFGRITQTSHLTEEDQFYQRFTADYAQTLNTAAWYEYDFGTELKNLWTQNSLFSLDFIRKFERKYLYTSEFLVKMAYAGLIKFSSNSMYGEISTTTVIVTDSLTEKMKSDASVEFLFTEDDLYVLRVPRYTAFTSTVQNIANQGVNLVEVAGNKTAILISVIAPKGHHFNPETTRTLFSQDLTNEPELTRFALVTPISELAEFIRSCETQHISIEHIYDF